MLSPDEIATFIRANLPLAPVPDVPQIRLHSASPGSGLWRLAERDRGFATPYWAYKWGGGLALARYLAETPHSVAGCRVLDLGTGSGIAAIAAAMAGAASVVAADIDRYAVIAAAVNAEANGVVVETLLDDLTRKPPLQVDVVLASDLFYEEGLAIRVMEYLRRCLSSGITVLVGDPLRAHLPLDQLELIAEYPGADFGAGISHADGRNAVFGLKP